MFQKQRYSSKALSVIDEDEKVDTQEIVIQMVNEQENKIVNDLQNEISSMAKSYNKLRRKHDDLIKRNNKQTQRNFLLKNVINDTKQKLKNKKTDKKLNIYQRKFQHWILKTVGLNDKYYQLFVQNDCDHIGMIQFFDKEFIRNDLGITIKPISKLILKHVQEFKVKIAEFDKALNNEYKQLIKYKQIFIDRGILTLSILKKDIQTGKDVKQILKIFDAEEIQNILDTIHGDEKAQIEIAKNEGSECITEGSITYNYR